MLHPRIEKIIGTEKKCPACQTKFSDSEHSDFTYIDCRNNDCPLELSISSDDDEIASSIMIIFQYPGTTGLWGDIDFKENVIRFAEFSASPNKRFVLTVNQIPKDLEVTLKYLHTKIPLWLTFS